MMLIISSLFYKLLPILQHVEIAYISEKRVDVTAYFFSR